MDHILGQLDQIFDNTGSQINLKMFSMSTRKYTGALLIKHVLLIEIILYGSFENTWGKFGLFKISSGVWSMDHVHYLKVCQLQLHDLKLF